LLSIGTSKDAGANQSDFQRADFQRAVFQRERYEMSVISKEQLKRDEQSLTIFLIGFNIALATIFLLICIYLS